MGDNKKNERIDSLQVVRAMAFVGVFLYHVAKSFPGEGILYDFFYKSPGRWGVSVFFVLSGFVMTYSYWNRPIPPTLKDAVRFSIKKIKKLYPLHLLMLFVGAVYLFLQHETVLEVLAKLAITVPLIQTWLPVGYQAINSVAWYLSVCVFIFFCFPYLLGLIKRNKKMRYSIIAILCVFVAQLVVGYCTFRFTSVDIKWITYCHPVFRLGDFAVGGFLASIYLNRKSASNSNRPLSITWGSVFEFVALALNVLACVVCLKAPENTVWFTYTSLFIPSTAVLVYVFSLSAGIVSKLLANRFTLWLAAVSPYAFLIHRLVINYFRAFTKYVLHREHVNFAIVIMVSFGITIVAVYVYQGLEKMVASMVEEKKM